MKKWVKSGLIGAGILGGIWIVLFVLGGPLDFLDGLLARFWLYHFFGIRVTLPFCSSTSDLAVALCYMFFSFIVNIIVGFLIGTFVGSSVGRRKIRL